MGNGQSRLYQKIYHALPSSDSPSSSSWFDKQSRPFVNSEDKTQFIYATITVLSQNGQVNIADHEVRLLYSRRENDRMVARMCAEKDGVVKAQIAPRGDGKDQAEAFQALKRHVEMSLDRILQDVSGALPASNSSKAERGGSSSTRSSPSSPTVATPTSPRSDAGVMMIETSGSQNRTAMPMDAPPAYGKAVRDWKSTEDGK